MASTLATKRLLLEPLAIEDAPRIQAIFPHWEVVRYLASGVPWPYPPDSALSYVRDVALPAMERGEEWHWTLRLRDDPRQAIGSAGLIRSDEHNRGFWLGVPWHRCGYMPEAAEAIAGCWFDVLGFERLRSYKAVANQASRRISERSGMHVVEICERDFVAGRLPAERWEISASAWRRRSHRE